MDFKSVGYPMEKRLGFRLLGVCVEYLFKSVYTLLVREGVLFRDMRDVFVFFVLLLVHSVFALPKHKGKRFGITRVSTASLYSLNHHSRKSVNHIVSKRVFSPRFLVIA